MPVRRNSVLRDALSDLSDTQSAVSPLSSLSLPRSFHHQLKESVYKFCQEEIAPRAADIDRQNQFPMVTPLSVALWLSNSSSQDLWPKLGGMGLLGITAPRTQFVSLRQYY